MKFFHYNLSMGLMLCCVVVYQCSIGNVVYTGDIEALFVLVQAVLDCYKHIRCLVEPIQLLPHPGLDFALAVSGNIIAIFFFS